MQKTTLCVIGYQEIPDDKQDRVKRKLEREIKRALEDGYTAFLTEYSEGVGRLLAQCINTQRQQYPYIFMEVVFPQPSKRELPTVSMHEINTACNGFKPLCNDCQADYPLSVTRYLVGQSSRVIVVYDGPDGQDDHDTEYAMDYARTMGRDLEIIEF